MLVGAVLVRFFRFFSSLFLLFFNHVVFLLSANRSIKCAAPVSARWQLSCVCFVVHLFLRKGVILPGNLDEKCYLRISLTMIRCALVNISLVTSMTISLLFISSKFKIYVIFLTE